ncbi:hypothetical protein L9F63_012638, partial [Diploptera punctata]
RERQSALSAPERRKTKTKASKDVKESALSAPELRKTKAIGERPPELRKTS